MVVICKTCGKTPFFRSNKTRKYKGGCGCSGTGGKVFSGGSGGRGSRRSGKSRKLRRTHSRWHGGKKRTRRRRRYHGGVGGFLNPPTFPDSIPNRAYPQPFKLDHDPNDPSNIHNSRLDPQTGGNLPTKVFESTVV